jgi:YesN/AraC family two-component response regulator
VKLELKPNEKLSVMIVDDEEDIRETLRMFLEMMELFTSIVEAEDGGDALRKTENQKFDLIITDLMMPKVRGIQLIEKYKREEAKKPEVNPAAFIILSANVTGEEVTKAIHFGVKYVITKPCSADEFVDKVQEVLAKEKRSKVRILKDE